MLALTLSAELEQRLEAAANRTGHTKISFAEEAIREHISDLEALQLNEGGLAAKWAEAVADNSDGLDSESVFERLEHKYSAMSESLPS